MPTVIGELTVRLGLNSANFREGSLEIEASLKQTVAAADRAAKGMQSSAARAAEGFREIRNEVLALAATILGTTGLTKALRDSTEQMASLGREAANLNADPQKLAAYSMAFERFGASAESTRQTLFGISQQIEQFRLTGRAPFTMFLPLIGADTTDDPFAIIDKFTKYAQEHKNDAPLVNKIGHGLGIDQGTINAALQMKNYAELQKAINDALRDAPTKQQVDQAQKLQTAWVKLKQAASKLGNKIATDLSPEMNTVLTWTTDLIHDQPGLVEALTLIGGAITALGAIRISAKAIGLTGVSDAIDALLAGIARLSVLALPLVTKGDSGPGPDTPGPHGWDFSSPDWKSGWWARHMPTWLGGASGPQPPVANSSLDAAQVAFLKALSAPESGGNYGAIGGSKETLTDLSRFPGGPRDDSGHYGRYQFDAETWAEEAAKLGLNDFSPASQDRAAWDLAATTYRRMTSRDLESDLKSGGHDADIARAIQGVWPSVPGGSQSSLPRSAADYGPQDIESHASSKQKANTQYTMPWDLFRLLLPSKILNSPLPKPGSITNPFPDYPGAADYSPPPGMRHSSGVGGGSVVNNDYHVSISKVDVVTKATDARGIAKDLNNAIVTQANRGLN